MKIVKVPDEFDMDLVKRDKVNPSKSCPYCGHKTRNKKFIKYEFGPKGDGTRLWKHDFGFRTRVREVGLYRTLFRKYHIMYICMKCISCGAEWCGDLVDDRKPQDSYLESGRFSECVDHGDNVVLAMVISFTFLFVITIVIAAIIFSVI